MAIRLKLRQLIRELDIPVRDLVRDMEGREATLYRLTSPTKGPPARIDLGTLDAILTALNRRSGRRFTFDDILEHESTRQSGYDPQP